MTDEQITKLAEAFLPHILNSKLEDQKGFLIQFGKKVERETRQRAYAMVMGLANKIDDRESTS